MPSSTGSGTKQRKQHQAAAPDPERLRFPDLVLAREKQQERLRNALLDQNRDLQKRLEDQLSPSRSVSQSGTDGAAGSTDVVHLSPENLAAQSPVPRSLQMGAAAASAAQPPQQRMRNGVASAAASSSNAVNPSPSPLPPPTRLEQGAPVEMEIPIVMDPVPTNGDDASNDAASQQGEPRVAKVDFSGILYEVRRIVAESQEAQRAAFESYRDHVDERLSTMQRAIDDVHDAMLKDEAARGILREEQMQQHLDLCAEMEKLRAELDDSTQRRQEEVAEVTKEAVERLEAIVQRCTERVDQLEDLPNTVRGDMAVVEERFDALAAGIAAERVSLSSQREEVGKQQQEELSLIIADARERLNALNTAAAEVTERASQAEAGVRERVDESVARVAEQLETEIMQRLDEQAERVNQTTQRQAMEHHTMQQEIQASLGEVKASVESSLLAMRRQYHDAVQEQLRAVVQQAEEFEEQRRAECPVADKDRVELMVQELQGASTMLEGVMATVATHQRADPRLPSRVDELEARIAELGALLEEFRKGATEGAIGAPLRISVSIPVQTDDAPELLGGGGGRGLGSAASVEQQVADRAQRHLAEELEKAADEVRLASARKVLAKGASTGQPSPLVSARPPNTVRAPLDRSSASPVAEMGSGSAAASARDDGYPRLRPSASLALPTPQQHTGGRDSIAASGRSKSVPMSPEAAAAALARLSDAELEQKRVTKAAMLQKVQELLRQIQATFTALAEQESAKGHTWPREKVEEVARQKHEMYARERQLVEQRNGIWQAVLQITEEQERRGIAAPGL